MRFVDMDVWQRSTRLSVKLYRHFENCRDRGFKDQITRSSLSIPSNISEGLERHTDRDCLKFLYYAKGSAAELYTQVFIGIRIGYIEEPTGQQWLSEVVAIRRMLYGLIKTRVKS